MSDEGLFDAEGFRVEAYIAPHQAFRVLSKHDANTRLAGFSVG